MKVHSVPCSLRDLTKPLPRESAHLELSANFSERYVFRRLRPAAPSSTSAASALATRNLSRVVMVLVHRGGRGQLLTQVDVDARCRRRGGHRRQHVLLVQLLLLLMLVVVVLPVDVRGGQEDRLHGQKAVGRHAVGLGGGLKVGGVEGGGERGHEAGRRRRRRVVRVLGRVADGGGGHVAWGGDGGGGGGEAGG